ncbi:hypothetical protein HELRODRAFT_137839, partial [Helobdella robusta]|uniref:Growth factor receptor domain-containing protein n=1 Tax=Helobdella robusta TaxID=6412 RepID=T1EIP0_HELRO
CVACHESCGSCSDELATSCLTCSMKHLWQENLCVQHCSPGYYKHPTSQNNPAECEKCDLSCDRCSGPAAHHCLQCKIGECLRYVSC